MTNPIKPAAPEPEVIYEFRLGREVLAKYRGRSEYGAVRRFEQDYPEWRDDLRAGKVTLTSRPPAY